MKRLKMMFVGFGGLRLWTVLVLISGLCAACATPIPYKLDPETLKRVGEVNVFTCIEDDDISVHVSSSGYGSGLGLVGALIDSGVNEKRHKEADRVIVPLREKTADIDFRQEFWDKLTPMLKEVTWPTVVDVKTVTKSDRIEASSVKDRGLLDIYTTYQLTTTAAALNVSTGFAFYLRGSTKPVALGSMLYSSERIGQYEENDEAIALWAENDASAYRQALNTGIDETIKMLRMAIAYAGRQTPPRPLEKKVKLKVRLIHGRGDYGIKESGSILSGWIMEESEERMIFQVEYGKFYSFPKKDIMQRFSVNQ